MVGVPRQTVSGSVVAGEEIGVARGMYEQLPTIASSITRNLIKIVFCVSCIFFCAASTASIRDSKQSTV